MNAELRKALAWTVAGATGGAIWTLIAILIAAGTPGGWPVWRVALAAASLIPFGAFLGYLFSFTD
jgi:hypothetical protein